MTATQEWAEAIRILHRRGVSVATIELCMDVTHAQIGEALALPASPARDVAPGESWAFKDHRTQAAVMAAADALGALASVQ